jgi:membrane fusion protein (multidrug efflux system)
VYVAAKDKDGKDIAQPRPVVVGDWVDADGGNLFVIDSGLKAGDNVIVNGVARLQPGGPIKLATSAPAPGAPAAPAGSPAKAANSAAPK